MHTTRPLKKVTVLESRVNELYNKNNKLHQENKDLKTRVMQLESLQLENNVLLSGVPESAWETVNQCRDNVIEALSWTIHSKGQQESLNAAAAVLITKFRQVGKYRLNRPRPILITFLYNYDKSYLF